MSSGGVSDNFIGYIVNHIIADFPHFVKLFLMISGFSMCCGYYEKIKSNQLSLDKYYKRRFSKILPFFTLLVAIDTVHGQKTREVEDCDQKIL